jgi:hypothetical protein
MILQINRIGSLVLIRLKYKFNKQRSLAHNGTSLFKILSNISTYTQLFISKHIYTSKPKYDNKKNCAGNTDH